MGDRKAEKEKDKDRGGYEFVFGNEKLLAGNGNSSVEKVMMNFFIF